MNLSKNSGNILIATGILHNVFGVVIGWPILVEMVRSGFVNSVTNEHNRNATFWFLFGGFMMIMLGRLMQNCIDAGWLLPKWLGVSLLILSLIGCLMMPASGFWLVIPQALLILNVNKKRRGQLV